MTIKGKDLLEQIKDKQYSKDVIKALEEYEITAPQSIWDLEKGDFCWRVNIFLDEWEYEYFQDAWSEAYNHYRLLGMIHLTKERAEHHARVLNTELAIKKWKLENDNVEFNWHDNDIKYFLMYDYDEEKIYIETRWYVKSPNTIYFSSRDKIEQCIKDIGKERVKEWLKWDDNDK